MQDKHGLLSAPIPDVLRQMTVPMTFGMMAVLTFNIIDTFFVSLLGTNALAAISFTFPVTFGINCITMGMGVGLSTNIAHSLGKGEGHLATRFITHGLLLTLIIIGLCGLAGSLFTTPIFALLHASADLQPLIHQYMSIWFVCIPLLALSMAGSSAIRASGNTRIPALIMILSGIINGALDPVFIFGLGPMPALGIKGAALSSGISWFIALLGILYWLLIREKRLVLPQLTTLLSDWRCILATGTPAALSNALNPICTAILMIAITAYGKEAVAAYGAAQRVEAILILVLMSLTSSLTPFMSQNFGANNHQRSFSALFLCMRFSVIFQLVIFIMMVPLSTSLASLFSHDPEVRHLLWSYLVIVPISYGFQGIMMMLISSLNALRHPAIAFLWSVIRLFLLVLPGALIGAEWDGIQGMFIGITVANVLGGILAYLHGLKLRKMSAGIIPIKKG